MESHNNSYTNFTPPPVWPAVYPPVYPIPIGHTPAYTIVRHDVNPFPDIPPHVTNIPPPYPIPGSYSTIGTYPTLYEAQVAAKNALANLGEHYASMGFTGFVAPHIDLDTIATVTYELADGSEILLSEFELKETRAPVWGHAAFEHHRPETELEMEQYRSERELFYPPHMSQPSMRFPSLNMPAGPKVVVKLPPKVEDARRASVGMKTPGQVVSWKEEESKYWAAIKTPSRRVEEGPFWGPRDFAYDATMQRNLAGRRRSPIKIVVEQPDELAGED